MAKIKLSTSTQTGLSQTSCVHDTATATHVFLLICIYRLANAWMVRTQFDPDEYWQTLEPAYCLAFGSNQQALQNENGEATYGCALTWEWTRRWTPSTEEDTYSMPAFLLQAMHGPIRSYVSILPTYWYYLACKSFFEMVQMSSYEHLKQFVHQNASYIISKGPAFLHAITIAAPTDLSVWLIASKLERLSGASGKDNLTRWSFWALFLSLISWFNGYALIRTYANCFETACLAVGLVLLGPELFDVSHSSNSKQHSLKAKLALVLGGLSACVRFTSLAAWVPLGIIVTVRSKELLRTLFGLCALYGAVGVFLGCCIDRIMYGFWAIPFLGNFHFNVLLGLGSLYGTHPVLWYMYAGIPAICGAALVPFLLEMKDSIKVISNPKLKRLNDDTKGRVQLLGIIIPYVILHSVSEHKEFRFVLPVLPLITVLAGHSIAHLTDKNDPSFRKKLRNCFIATFVGLNIPHLLYLGTVHQRGPIAVNQYLTDKITAMMQTQRQQTIHVHYLMGCHSTPLYSHLHIPDVRIRVWVLDCSPDCRSQSDIVCQSDAFLANPEAFVTSVYAEGNTQVCDNQDNEQCFLEQDKMLGFKDIPDFIVVMQDEAARIDHGLNRLGMRNVGSVKHTIKSLSLHQSNIPPCSSTFRDKSICHDSFTILSLLDIQFQHIEIYQATSRVYQKNITYS